jgi:hypothetical protein
MDLPGPIAEAVQPLFDGLPLDAAMGQLVVSEHATAEFVRLVEGVLAEPAMHERPILGAGLWLYVDELDRSHRISQGASDSTGSFWHGIMHRREGDFSNSHYWFRKTGHHPAMDGLDGYDGHAFVDEVETHYLEQPAKLVALQRAEWSALFSWCASQ